MAINNSRSRRKAMDTTTLNLTVDRSSIQLGKPAPDVSACLVSMRGYRRARLAVVALALGVAVLLARALAGWVA